MKPLPAHRPARLNAALRTLVVVLVGLVSSATGAETRVEGQADSIRIEAHEASIHEVLAALSAAFGVRVHASTAFDAVISGTYQGSLQRVVGRLLSGHDYVAKYSAESVEITVLASRNAGEPVPPGAQPRVTFVRNVAATPAAYPVAAGGLRTSLTAMRRDVPRRERAPVAEAPAIEPSPAPE